MAENVKAGVGTAQVGVQVGAQAGVQTGAQVGVQHGVQSGAQNGTKSAAEMSRAEQEAREAGAVLVEIYDQVYQLRGTDPEYIQRLATVVDKKMRAVSAHGATVDSLRVAVLAALNIADELIALRSRFDTLNGSLNQAQSTVRTRTGSLAGMLDEVLAERKAG